MAPIGEKGDPFLYQPESQGLNIGWVKQEAYERV